jgi:hypothetical protein
VKESQDIPALVVSHFASDPLRRIKRKILQDDKLSCRVCRRRELVA